MNITVAYDITQLAYSHRMPNSISGISRVIEEVLQQLSTRKDVTTYLTTLCAENPPSASLLAEEYLRDSGGIAGLELIKTYRSRLGLDRLYRLLYGPLLSISHDTGRGLTPASFLSKGIQKVMTVIQTPDIVLSLKEHDPHIFHSPFLGLPSRSATADADRLITIYDLIPAKRPEFTTRHFSWLFHRILASIDVDRDWAVCISEYTKQEFCDYTRMSPDRVFVTPLAASSHFHPVSDDALVVRCRERYGIPEGDYFLTLAALQPRKNLSHLIRCFIQFVEATGLSDVSLVLAGASGWKYSEIIKTIKRLDEYRERIVFTGYVRDEDLAAVYSGATAFLFPSLYEGFGLPPLEAMQCGVPVITSNTTSLPEVVGDAGIMVNPRDQDALCQAMVDITSSPETRQRYRENGLRRASLFSWAACADRTVEAYKKVVANR